MIEAQLVTGATQEIRIFTGSALCAAVAPRSVAAAMLASINFNRRMDFPPGDLAWFWLFGRFLPRGLLRGHTLGKRPIGAAGAIRATPPPARGPWSRPRTAR